MKTIKIIVESGVVQDVIFPNGYKNCLDYEVIDYDITTERGGIMWCDTCNNNYFIISNDEFGNDEIQKCDDCNMFKSDQEAKRYSEQNTYPPMV